MNPAISDSGLREAVARLRRDDYDFERRGVTLYDLGKRGGDLELLAAAFLALFPADDAEPVTAEWLRSVGYAGDYGILGRGAVLVDYRSGGEAWELDAELAPLPKPATRGDVRRLAAALGEPLASP